MLDLRLFHPLLKHLLVPLKSEPFWDVNEGRGRLRRTEAAIVIPNRSSVPASGGGGGGEPLAAAVCVPVKVTAAAGTRTLGGWGGTWQTGLHTSYSLLVWSLTLKGRRHGYPCRKLVHVCFSHQRGEIPPANPPLPFGTTGLFPRLCPDGGRKRQNRGFPRRPCCRWEPRGAQ